MKKIFLLVAIVALIITGCSTSVENAPEENREQQTTQAPTTEPTTIVNEPPSHPEEFILFDDLIASDFYFFPTMRRIWYQIPFQLTDIIPEGVIEELFESNNNASTERTEMPLVTLIKHLDIQRETLEEIIKMMEAFYREFDFDLTHEDNEIPDLDIIFTFDNEIINAFYRRENPVAPDWWPREN